MIKGQFVGETRTVKAFKKEFFSSVTRESHIDIINPSLIF